MVANSHQDTEGVIALYAVSQSLFSAATITWGNPLGAGTEAGKITPASHSSLLALSLHPTLNNSCLLDLDNEPSLTL